MKYFGLHTILIFFLFHPLYAQDFRFISEYEFRKINKDFLNPENILNLHDHWATSILIYQDRFKIDDENRIIVLGRGQAKLFRINGRDGDRWDHEFDFQATEAYFNHSDDRFSISVGRKKIKWGVGYVSSPTDIISRPPGPDDSDDHLAAIPGSDVLQLSFPKEKSQFEIIFLPATKINKTYDQLNAFAARYYRYLQPFDMSFVARVDQRLKYQLGYNMAVTVGDAVELHGEFLFDAYNPAQIPDPVTMMRFIPDESKTYRFLIGGQYSPSSKVNIAAEYLHFENGYTRQQWQDYAGIVELLHENHYVDIFSERADDALRTLARQTRSPLQKSYLFTRFFYRNQNRTLSIESVNFSDLRYLDIFTRLAISFRFRDTSPVRLFSHLVWITGGKGEFASFGHPFTFRLGCRWLW